MKTQMIMSKVKIKSLLLLTYLAMGIPSLHAAETLQVWIRASNDSKNIYKKEADTFEKKPASKLSISMPLLILNNVWHGPLRVTRYPT